MIIFIPVLFICVNAQCEFMQAKAYYQTNAECRSSLYIQKEHMKNLIAQSGQGKPEILEGTCIDADVKIKSKTELDT